VTNVQLNLLIGIPTFTVLADILINAVLYRRLCARFDRIDAQFDRIDDRFNSLTRIDA
jgi:hypothetical protein